MTKKQKKMLTRIIAAAVLLILLNFLPVTGIIRFVLFLIPYLIVGYDILKKAWKGILNRQVFDENFLMAVATFGAFGVQEYSEATTSQLINPATKDWDYELIDMLGFPRGIFQKVLMPGTTIGSLTDEVKELVGYDCKVVLPPTHDTASAVMAIPTNAEDTCYISSGTWSLMGVEMAEANCSPKSKEANFTNEGGYGGKITYLANIMGLWMIQSVRNQLAPDMSYGDLCEQASHETIQAVVDCQDSSFLSPDDMVEAVKDYCRKTNQEVPETLPALASVIYNSLAKCYAEKLEEIQRITGVKYDKINIIGGGSNAAYLNELTAKYTGVGVHAGPGEATAIGNILSQMLEDGTFADLKEARNCVADSFEIKIY